MKYQASITTTQDIETLYKSLITEKTSSSRTELDVSKNSDKLTIKISAEDSTALRAMLNGVCKLLNVYEKIQNDTTTTTGNTGKNKSTADA